ncbi:MAG: prepilin-type N-terminal cleavage/methylation domain-containing protein [Campylobacterota bacterium]
MRKGFTLVEVMIAVVIISVVISALLEIYANSAYTFLKLDKKSAANQYLSFVVDNRDYGLENKNATLHDLLKDFDIDDDLKKELKSVKVKIIYQKLQSIDLSDREELKDTDSQVVFEIGKTILKLNDSSSSILRVNLQ